VNPATLYVLCPDHDKASGGIKILYRHVDVLCRAGYRATLLHQKPGFRCSWFHNTTHIAYLPEVQLTTQDVLVIPEVFGPNIPALAALPNIGRKVRKVIFNQNGYYTFLGHTLETALRPDAFMAYAKSNRDEYIAAIVVSEDSQRYLRHAFPDLPVYRIHNAINTHVFRYQREKKHQICYMPRKHPEDAVQVLGILNARGMLKDLSVVPIDQRTEEETAAIMRDSLIFLSFGYPEGCPLPPAEAMACGCVVVGYHGMGGAEYFHPDFSCPIPIQDIVSFAQAVESVLTTWQQAPDAVLDRGQRASRYIHEYYSTERETHDILTLWRELMPAIAHT
jgi:glycosyltransferase involved in cell wall biosynthesis